jgi:DNA-directed RNA polymerase specialized sigma subunit
MLRIMELRYLEFLDWEEIAREVGYFHTSVYRIHRRALDLLPPPPATPGEGMP